MTGCISELQFSNCLQSTDAKRDPCYSHTVRLIPLIHSVTDTPGATFQPRHHSHRTAMACNSCTATAILQSCHYSRTATAVLQSCHYSHTATAILQSRHTATLLQPCHYSYTATRITATPLQPYYSHSATATTATLLQLHFVPSFLACKLSTFIL